MAFTFSSSGLTIQTYAQVLADVQSEYRSRISARVATSAGSLLGQVQRITALFSYRAQERLQYLYQSLDPRLAEGAHLDARLLSLGLTREPALRAEVLGTITTTDTATITNGTRYSCGGFVFAVIGGPYSRTGAGTITGVRLQSELYQAIDVSGLGAWTVVDAIADVTGFDDTSQPIVGRTEETDAEFRARAEEERYARANGPLDMIEAGVGLVEGVTYARAYDNTDPSSDPDSNGIPYDAVNVVVSGGTDAAVAQAIEDYGPSATRYYGATEVTLGSGATARVVGFDRVADVDMYLRITVTSSTSESAGDALSQPELEDALQTLLASWTATNWTIGKDVIPAEIIGAVMTAGIPAIDAVTVEQSIDGSTWFTTKRTITIRQQAKYSNARLTVPTPL